MRDENFDVLFLKKIVEMKENNQLTYDEMADEILGEENRWSSENWRKFFYIFREILNKLEDNIEITEDDLLTEIENAKVELYKEKVKLRDQRRELNKLHTSQARFENLKEVMEQRLEEIGSLPYVKVKPYEDDFKGAVLCIGDLHYGLKVDNQFNYYDTDVAVERLNKLIAKTIEKCKLHKINKLNVEIGGDLVSGIIHTGLRVQQEEDIITQIIDVSEILSDCISNLANNINEVRVITSWGNHGRVIPNKHDSLNQENFERLIYYYMKKRVKNVVFLDGGNNDFVRYYDFGKTFVSAHGDKDKKATCVADYEKILGETVDEVHLNHYHSYEESSSLGYVINGSIIGADDYAVSIRKVSRPMQVLKVYGDDEITYKLYLD